MTVSVSSNAADDCGEYGCGQNSPTIDGVPFWGLWLNGDENEAHVKYKRYARSMLLMKLGVYTPLDVSGGRLRAWWGGAWHWGTELENGIIEIAINNAPYFVKIAEVHSGSLEGEPFWTDVATGPYAETYRLQWNSPAEPPVVTGQLRFHDICKHTTLDSELWHNQIDAVVFEGEHYDLETRKITVTPTAPYAAWFNIACAGSTPAKQYLTRRTTASGVFPSYVSAIDNDRQAMTRAWAADYCGNGTSFTMAGHLLLIQDHLPVADDEGWLPRVPPIGFSDDDLDNREVTLEAVWNADGAVCLETPRMADKNDPIGWDKDIEHRILAECARPPKCSEQSWYPDNWYDHGQLRTAVP